MTKKARKAIARIMAVLMVFTLLPFQVSADMAMVEASETSESTGGGYKDDEAFSETDVEEAASAEDASADTENVTVTQSESAEDTLTEDKTDTEQDEEGSASVSDIRMTEETKEVEEEKEEQKESAERRETLKANTEGYELSNTFEWVFSKEFFEQLGYTGNGTISTDKPIEGIAILSGKVSNKMTETTPSLSLGSSAKIGLAVQNDTDAIEITITMAGVNSGRSLGIGEGDNKETIYHKSSDGTPSFNSNKAYTNEDLYLKTDSIFSDVLSLEAIGGENKIVSIVLKEYKTSGSSKENASTPTATPSGGEIKIGEKIELSCDTSDVAIYYTTDGSNPKTSDSKDIYNKDSGIEIIPTMVNEDNQIIITAYAVGDNYAPSDIMTCTYTALKGDNQLDEPTAEPDDSEAVIRGTEITLKSNDESVSIYYTFDEALQLTKENGTLFDKDAPIVINEETKIKAIAVAEGKIDSSPAVFAYTIKTPTIAVAESSKNTIGSVKMKGDVIFRNESNVEVFDVKLSGQEALVSTEITEKAESIKKEGGEILSYELSLINEENAGDQVSISEGTLDIKILYAIASSKAGRKNEITVLQGTKEIAKIRKDVDGMFFNIDSVEDPFTFIINPVPVEEEDEMAPKTYILDPEDFELTGDLETDTKYGTEDYFTVAVTSTRKAAIAEISSVTTGSGDNKVNCYDNLNWSDEVMEAIGGGRTQCLRITGGALGPDKNDNNKPSNCVRITTTTSNARVAVYFSPKDTTSRKIKVAKDNAGKIGDSVGTYPGTGVTCKNIGTAKFTLSQAGTYYIGFDGGGGIIPYMEVTETPEVPVIDMPTADPVSGTSLNRKSEITLKTEVDEADIYYTTNGDDPVNKEDSVNKKYTAPLAVADLASNDNKITIKAISVTKSGKSEVATFEYDYDPTAVATAIDEDSKAIIRAVETVGNVSEVTRGGQSLQITDITVKAQELEDTAVDNDIKTAAEALVTDTDKSNIKYYNISLILNDETEISADTVTFKENAALKIKMLYSNFQIDALGDVTEENEIFVLHNAEQIAAEKITTEVVTSQNAEDAGIWFEAESFSPYTVVVNPAQPKELGTVKITKFAGYEEGAYAEWEAYKGADGYKAYVAAKEDGEFQRIDNELIREYENHWRVDTVGLTSGSSYYLKIEAVKVKTEGDDENVQVLADKVVGPMTVTNYDRSGFAFSSESPFKSGSGAYKDNGELKDGAQVIYVTKNTAKTCKAMIHTAGANNPAVEVTGLQAILDAKQKKGTENDIIDIRIIGRVAKDDLDYISSKAEGLQVKGAAKYNEMNITIEGIGEDAVVHGFGFLIRYCGNVELRNFAIMAFMDDGVSLDTGNCNIWVHDLDIFYGSTGGDSDQAKGDGSVDVKGKSTYVTISYNHFWDSGKCSLCGMGDTEEFMVTYHHNWFDHSDSRHPRIRVGSIHVYNNYFDGNSKYGVGVTKGSSAFVEANYFRNCKYPMLISQQGSDLSGDGKGTFSGEPGGMIKAYANKIEGEQRLVYANKANGSMPANATEFDAYLAEGRDEKVPDSYKTLNGSTPYNNFDTSYDLGVKADAVDSADKVKDIVTKKAGRLNGGDFKRKPEYAISTDDQSYAVDTVLKADVVNYQSSIIRVGGIGGIITGPGTGGGEGPGGNTPGGGDKPSTSGGGIYVHNFTTDGFSSDEFFTINGNKQSKPTTVNYVDPNGNPLVLSQALKMESSTKISFHAAVSGTLIIVLVPESGKIGKTKVDGVNQDPADGIIEVYFDTAGSHTIEKGDKADVYYIAYVEDTYDTDDVREPVFDMPSGNLPIGTPISLTCATQGARIYYTTDNSTPTAGSTEYTGTPIVLEGVKGESVTVKAIAIKDDKESTIVTCTYTFVDFNEYVAHPVSSAEDGIIEKGTAVTLTSITEDAEIYFTYKTDGTQPADPNKDNGTLYSGPIVINRSIIIKAIAIKGDIQSEISIFEYIVSQGGDNDNISVSHPVAFPPSGTYEKGTEISLGAELGAKIYYTTDNSEPTTDSTLYATEFVLEEDIIIKAVAQLDGKVSETVTFEYKVQDETKPEEPSEPEEPSVPEGIGLRIAFKNANETYTYTGSAIKPDIVVWNNSDKLVEGTDYTVKYTNNINASVDAKENKKPKITVTGKGNLTGTSTTTFEIQKKQLEDTKRGADPVVIGGVTDNGELIVVEKSTASPVLYYGGVKLSNKDYSISDAKKKYALGEIGKIIITGKGNFAGTLTYDLKVIRKNELKKFTVSFAAPNYTYNGEPQKIELKDGDVKDADGNILKEGQNYTVVYQSDLTNAGTVKFTVVGLGYYTGSVAKSYTIKPNAVTSGMEITGVSSEPYPYTGLGVTIPVIGVSYQGTPLEEGRDYKLAYGSNKKVGTAKCTVSFMGNYKGSKAISKNFTIGANSLTDETEGVKIVIPNMVFNRPGVYKSKPYVSVNGVEVKASEYMVKYYTDKDRTAEMGKIMEADTEVYVKIEGKDKSNYKGMLLTASYKVQKKPETAIDLSKAKVTVYTDWSDSATKNNKLEYTGKEIEPGVMIEIKQGNVTLSPKNVKQLMDEEKLTITYTNNIHKGKATMIINGDGEIYVGSKTATFSITTKNIKDTKILDDLFEKIAAMCSVRYLVEAP